METQAASLPSSQKRTSFSSRDPAQPGERPGGGGSEAGDGSPTAEQPSTQSSSPPLPTLGSPGRDGGCESADLGGWAAGGKHQQPASRDPCLPRMDRAGC